MIDAKVFIQEYKRMCHLAAERQQRRGETASRGKAEHLPGGSGAQTQRAG